MSGLSESGNLWHTIQPGSCPPWKMNWANSMTNTGSLLPFARFASLASA